LTFANSFCSSVLPKMSLAVPQILRRSCARPLVAARHFGAKARDGKTSSMLIRDLDDVNDAGNYKKNARGKWESRRFLTRDDGFGFSFHHTVMYKDKSSFQWYKNHTESVYITKGTGTIEIVQEGSPENYEHLIGTGVTYDLKAGTMYALAGEKHILTATSEGGMHCMCVFNPPVAGTEDHNERGVYPAVDDDGKAHFEFDESQVATLFKPPVAYAKGSEWCE